MSSLVAGSIRNRVVLGVENLLPVVYGLEPATYSVTGFDLVDPGISYLERGTYSVSGGDAVVSGRTVLGSGSYAVSGSDAPMSGRTLLATGTYTSNGGDLLEVDAIALEGATYTLSGSPITISGVTQLESGSYALSGGDVNVLGTSALSGGAYTLTGGDLSISGVSELDGGAYSLTGQPASVSGVTQLDGASYTLSGGDLTLINTIVAVTIDTIGPQASSGSVPYTYTTASDQTVEAVLIRSDQSNPAAADFNSGDTAPTLYDLGTVALTSAGSAGTLTGPDDLDGNYKLCFLPSGGGDADVAVSATVAIDSTPAGITDLSTTPGETTMDQAFTPDEILPEWRFSVWADGSTPSDSEIASGTGSVATVTGSTDPAAADTAQVTGLTASTTYVPTLYTKDEFGNETFSTLADATTTGAASPISLTYGNTVNSFSAGSNTESDVDIPAGDKLIVIAAISNLDRSANTFEISDVGDVGGSSSVSLTKIGTIVGDTGDPTINAMMIDNPWPAGGVTKTVKSNASMGECSTISSDIDVTASVVTDGADTVTDNASDTRTLSVAVLDGDGLIGAMQQRTNSSSQSYSTLSIEHDNASAARHTVAMKEVVADDAGFGEGFEADTFNNKSTARMLIRLRAI